MSYKKTLTQITVVGIIMAALVCIVNVAMVVYDEYIEIVSPNPYWVDAVMDAAPTLIVTTGVMIVAFLIFYFRVRSILKEYEAVMMAAAKKAPRTKAKAKNVPAQVPENAEPYQEDDYSEQEQYGDNQSGEYDPNYGYEEPDDESVLDGDMTMNDFIDALGKAKSPEPTPDSAAVAASAQEQNVQPQSAEQPVQEEPEDTQQVETYSAVEQKILDSLQLALAESNVPEEYYSIGEFYPGVVSLFKDKTWRVALPNCASEAQARGYSDLKRAGKAFITAVSNIRVE